MCLPKEGWRVYPNPAKATLFFEGVSEMSQVMVYNVLGQLVLTDNVVNNSIDIGQLFKGIYIIRFVNGKKIEGLRFVKM